MPMLDIELVQPDAARPPAAALTQALADELPVFATVLHAHLPQGDALVAEAAALTQALAACLGRSPQRVHVHYAPAAVGRQAFGGVLVR